MLTIWAGKYKVVETGTVIQFNNEPILFALNDLQVVFNFLSDSENEPKTESYMEGGALNFDLINFNDSLATGNTSPIEIGILDGQKLYVNLRAYAFGNLDEPSSVQGRTIHFTFYVQEGENDE